MAHVSFTDLRQNMARYFDRVTDDESRSWSRARVEKATS